MVVAGRVVPADQADDARVAASPLGGSRADHRVMRGQVERATPGRTLGRGEPAREIWAEQPTQRKCDAVRERQLPKSLADVVEKCRAKKIRVDVPIIHESSAQVEAMTLVGYAH